MTAPNPTVECPACGGPSRVLSTVTHRASTGTVFRCQRCNRKTGKLDLGRDDPEDTHALIRRKLNALLKPLATTRS